MAFDEFVGIFQAFELSRSYGKKEKKKEDPYGIALKGSTSEDHMSISSSKVQCFECNGFGHVRKECANLLKQKERDDKNDTDDDSDDGEKLKNFVAFTTFVPGSKIESTTGSTAGSASASVSGSSCGGDDDAGSEDDDGGSFDLAGNYEKLYEHWLKLVEANSDLVKEKAKLEAQVAEAIKYASEKEEEARQAVAQLAETQKGLRMLNNGTDQLDQLLSIGQSDRCGLGYQGECSKAEGVFVSAGKTKDVATSDKKPEVKRFAGNATYRKIAVNHATSVKNVTATSTATATDTATAPERVSGLKSGSQQRFRPVCYHCGVVGHIRPWCFKLLREKNQMEQAYGLRFNGPICYSCGVQGHMRRDCVKSVQEANHGGFGLMNTWSTRFDHYGDGGMGFPPYFGGYGSSC
uniref:CCHC-type domain-containing protein n=1 Tax=Brassica oleracea var. oleracea TaxID=109376 RepID=A0A0D3CWS1_BRAOL